MDRGIGPGVVESIGLDTELSKITSDAIYLPDHSLQLCILLTLM